MFWRILITPAIIIGNKIHNSIRHQRILGKGIIANIESKIYHIQTCSAVARILDQNKVIYHDLVEVYAFGYRACEVCKPPEFSPKPKQIAKEIKHLLKYKTKLEEKLSKEDKPEKKAKIQKKIEAIDYRVSILRRLPTPKEEQKK